MPKFEVHYSFKCRKCEKSSENRVEVQATDKINAFQKVHDQVNCEKCAAAMEPQQPFTTTIKQLD